MATEVRTDGASRDGGRIEIEAKRATWRLRCPAGHSSWAPTNNHVWCRVCSRASTQGDDLDPEVYELWDQKTGELVPWDRIVLVG